MIKVNFWFWYWSQYHIKKTNDYWKRLWLLKTYEKDSWLITLSVQISIDNIINYGFEKYRCKIVILLSIFFHQYYRSCGVNVHLSAIWSWNYLTIKLYSCTRSIKMYKLQFLRQSKFPFNLHFFESHSQKLNFAWNSPITLPPSY